MNSLIRKYWWMLLALLLAGCAAGVDPLTGSSTSEANPSSSPSVPTADVSTPRPQPPTPTAPEATSDESIEVPAIVPEVDVSLHSVPLEEIYFDTFQPVNRAVPLSQAPPELIQQLRDAIPPIHNPKYEPATEATWLGDKDVVIGYTAGDRAWAYPIRILNFHEIVNDTLDGEPLVITYWFAIIAAEPEITLYQEGAG